MSGDPCSDSFFAISEEEATAGVRAAGIICPPCGVDQADLPVGHWLTIDGMTATCTSNPAPHPLADFSEMQAAMNTDLYQRILRDALWGDGFCYEVTRDGEGNTVSVRGLSPAELRNKG